MAGGGRRVSLRNGVRAGVSFIPAPWRYGATYLRTSRWLSRTEFESSEQRKRRAAERLASILVLARQHTSFWGGLGIQRGAITGDMAWHVLTNLPTVEKEQIRDSLDDFTRTDVPTHEREYLTTSGSSAVPRRVYLLGRSATEGL